MNFNAHFIVKAIVRELIDTKRVVMEGDLRASTILIDHNPKKVICRLEFNTNQLTLIFVDQMNREERIPIASVNDIYHYSERIQAAALYYATD